MRKSSCRRPMRAKALAEDDATAASQSEHGSNRAECEHGGLATAIAAVTRSAGATSRSRRGSSGNHGASHHVDAAPEVAKRRPTTTHGEHRRPGQAAWSGSPAVSRGWRIDRHGINARIRLIQRRGFGIRGRRLPHRDDLPDIGVRRRTAAEHAENPPNDHQRNYASDHTSEPAAPHLRRPAP